jgi:hypothetical protein
MILDIKANPRDARRYKILDAATGKDLGAVLPIWYADDEAGVIRVHDHDLTPQGQFIFRTVPAGDEVAWTEYRRAIRIVPREGNDADA